MDHRGYRRQLALRHTASSTPKSHKEFCENPAWDTYKNYLGSFDLELLVNPLVLDRILLKSLVVFEAVCGFDNARRKVRVLFVL